MTKKQVDNGMVADLNAQLGAVIVADEFGPDAMWMYDPLDVWDMWLEETYGRFCDELKQMEGSD